MANENGALPNIGLDMSKLPLYGQDDERLLEINQAQKDAVKSLEERYKNPNWFKVAAGFAKPQLGGFLASLGSAAEAMGENVEQERAQKLPIAQMKLQLAQSNMLLSANKKVADQAKAWKAAHPGQTPSAQQLGEWAASAPDSPVVKALQSELDYQQKQQTNTIQRIQEQSKHNMPLSARDMEYLKDQPPEGSPRADVKSINAPPSVPVAPAQKAEVKPVIEEKGDQTPRINSREPNMTYVLPNGARATREALELHKQGIPIISNLRNEDERKKLVDHADEAGNLYTKEGNPVAKTIGKHGTGDAIDIDHRKLTDKHRDILKNDGWHQPEWATDKNSKQYDPNHWERKSTTPIKAEEKPEKVNQAPTQEKGGFYPHSVIKPKTEGMGEADLRNASEIYKANAERTEAPISEKISNLTPIFGGNSPTYTNIKHNYDSAINLIEKNPKLADKVFAIVKQGGGIQNALNTGIGFSAGPLQATIHLPVEAYKVGELKPHEQAYADKLYSALVTIAIANLQQEGTTMGKTPQGEYMKALSQHVNPGMTSLAALSGLHKERVQFDHNKEYYDQIMKERREKVDPNSPTPYSDILNNSSELRRKHEKYDAIHRKYDEEFQKQLYKMQGK